MSDTCVKPIPALKSRAVSVMWTHMFMALKCPWHNLDNRAESSVANHLLHDILVVGIWLHAVQLHIPKVLHAISDADS